METCSFVHMLMITFLFVIELTPHMETMPFAMLCQISGTNYLNHFVLLTVLKLLNLIWKHIYFQNDIVSIPSKVVIKLFIYLSCSVLYFKIFVKRFVHIYAEALYKYCLLLLLLLFRMENTYVKMGTTPLISLARGKHVWRAAYHESIFPYKSQRKLMEMWRRWSWRSKLVAHHGFAMGCLAWYKGTYYGSILFLHYCQKLYKLNEFNGVRRWCWMVPFFKIRICW